MISSKKYLFTAVICTCLFLLDCGDSNSSSVSPHLSYGIIGTWKLEKESNVGQVDVIHPNADELLKFTDSNLVFFSNNVQCYKIDTVPYSYSGNTLSSTYVSGEVTINGSIMTVTAAEKGYTGYYRRYLTSVPPDDWPKIDCISLIHKKKYEVKAIQY